MSELDCEQNIYEIRSSYFSPVYDSKLQKSLASELPDGRMWDAKWLKGKLVYSLTLACAKVLNQFRNIISVFSKELDIDQTDEYLEKWEESVGGQIPGFDYSTFSKDRRRKLVKFFFRKVNVVRLVEMQEIMDCLFKEYGIWFEINASGQSFRYDFRYDFGGDGWRNRFIIYVNIPWFTIDPDGDGSTDKVSWEYLQKFLRKFFPAYVQFIPIYHPEASYLIITDPINNDTVFTAQDPNILQWSDINVRWKTIDIDTTVKNYIDTENIPLGTTEITRSFTDSTSSIIETTNNITTVEVAYNA